jgi:hypothetical protein
MSARAVAVIRPAPNIIFCTRSSCLAKTPVARFTGLIPPWKQDGFQSDDHPARALVIGRHKARRISSLTALFPFLQLVHNAGFDHRITSFTNSLPPGDQGS